MLWLALLCWLQHTSALGAMEFPSPQRDYKLCGRSRASYICDPDFVLDRGNVEKLDLIAQEFRKSTLCPCKYCTDKLGVAMGIFIRKNLTQESVFKYSSGKALAEMLRKRWNLSQCNGDIVVVLITELNITDYSMGAAVQSLFPAGTAEQIMKDCMVHFYSGWFYQGLESIVNSFNDVLVKLQKENPQYFKSLMIGIGLGFLVLLILSAATIIILKRQARRKKHCDDILEDLPTSHNRRKGSFDKEKHLNKLNHLNLNDEDDEDESPLEPNLLKSNGGYTMHMARLQRQLSDVAEESSEDSDMLKRNSEHESLTSSVRSWKQTCPFVPVTEL